MEDGDIQINVEGDRLRLRLGGQWVSGSSLAMVVLYSEVHGGVASIVAYGRGPRRSLRVPHSDLV